MTPNVWADIPRCTASTPTLKHNALRVIHSLKAYLLMRNTLLPSWPRCQEKSRPQPTLRRLPV